MKLPTLQWPSIAPPDQDGSQGNLAVRLLWMAGIWCASVAGLLAVALLLRLVLRQ